jgi:hypothetical protein
MNSALEELICDFNKLLNLILPKNSELKILDCRVNNLMTLDLSNCTFLENLLCFDNDLTSLDLSNNLILNRLEAGRNPNLFCIQVIDSAIAANKPYWWKDDWAVYSEDCSTVSVDEGIDLANDITISPNPATDYIEINVGNRHAYSLQKDLKIYNSLGECVMHLTPALSEGEGARIDVSGLVSGVYFVRDGDRVSKFVKI